MIALVFSALLFSSAFGAHLWPVNVGGNGAWVTNDGITYVADNSFSGGNKIFHGQTVTNVDPANQRIFQSVREGPSFVYNLEVPSSDYELVLGFYERRPTDPGRDFSITVEGEVIEPNFDIVAEAGGVRLAVTKTYIIKITDGVFDMSLISSNNQDASLANFKLTAIDFTGLHINVGGNGDWIVGDGTFFLADFGFTGGVKVFHGQPIPGIPDTDDRIFQSVREGNSFFHDIPIPDGEYNVELGFYERRPTDPNRIFSISIEGDMVEAAFNIAAEAGGVRLPVIKNYNVVVEDSSMTILLSTSTNQPASLCYISITPIVEPTTAEPTTEEPTTEEPTTEPITEEPTTEPITEEPTTEPPLILTPFATCFITPTTGNLAFGEVIFSADQEGNGWTEAKIFGLSPNSEHGWHIHMWGDISDSSGSRNGGVFNPSNAPSGCSSPPGRDGDLGNLTTDENGVAEYFAPLNASLDIEDPAFIIGRSVNIHVNGACAQGGAGARIGQCVIGYKNPDL